MILYRVEVVVRSEQLARATALFTELCRLSRAVPGVRSFDILQDPEDRRRFVSIEVFDDQAAVDRQSALPQVDEVIALFPQLLSDGPHGMKFHAGHGERWPVVPSGPAHGQPG